MASTDQAQDQNEGSSDREIDEYGLYWESHLEVYRQPIVWMSRVLTIREQSFIYLFAILAATNCLIMLITAFPLSSLLFVGVVLLGLSGLLFVCLLSNISNQFRIFLNWGERESKDYRDVCHQVGWSHLQLKSLVKYIVSLREKEPKKFYGYGILFSIILSNLGTFVSTPVLLHLISNFLLLLPLALHNKLHTHLMAQDWIQLGQSVHSIGHILWESPSNFVRRLTAQRPAHRRVTPQHDHMTPQPDHVTLQPDHVT